MQNDQLLAARTLSEMSNQEREKVFEALIFASREPVTKKDLAVMFGSEDEVKKLIDKLKNFYDGRGIQVFSTKKSVAFRTSADIKHLTNFPIIEKKKISKAAIETLAIIVYHQPVTRAEIEEIRGVAFGTNTLDILMELNWVKPQGRKDVPGKPIQYGTTDDFLSHFNLQKLTDLPTVDELGSAGLIDSSAIDASVFGTGKFYQEKQEEKKENIYSNIDEMLSSTLKDKESE